MVDRGKVLLYGKVPCTLIENHVELGIVGEHESLALSTLFVYLLVSREDTGDILLVYYPLSEVYSTVVGPFISISPYTPGALRHRKELLDQ